MTITDHTLARLETARQLLDAQRLDLDKQPIATSETQVNQVAELVTTIRALIDDIGDALTPHTRHLGPERQHTLTGGWVLYDPDRPTTWPPANTTILIRQYHTEPEDGRNRYRDQRRGHYTAGRLWWRYRGLRPLHGSVLDGAPVEHGWTYAWKPAD